MTASPPAAPFGPMPSDPPAWRLAFHVLQKAGPWWITLWLILIIGGLVALGLVVGPWVPGALTAVAALTAGGTAVARRLGSGQPAFMAPDPAPDPSSGSPP